MQEEEAQAPELWKQHYELDTVLPGRLPLVMDPRISALGRSESSRALLENCYRVQSRLWSRFSSSPSPAVASPELVALTDANGYVQLTHLFQNTLLCTEFKHACTGLYETGIRVAAALKKRKENMSRLFLHSDMIPLLTSIPKASAQVVGSVDPNQRDRLGQEIESLLIDHVYPAHRQVVEEQGVLLAFSNQFWRYQFRNFQKHMMEQIRQQCLSAPMSVSSCGLCMQIQWGMSEEDVFDYMILQGLLNSQSTKRLPLERIILVGESLIQKIRESLKLA